MERGDPICGHIDSGPGSTNVTFSRQMVSCKGNLKIDIDFSAEKSIKKRFAQVLLSLFTLLNPILILFPRQHLTVFCLEKRLFYVSHTCNYRNINRNTKDSSPCLKDLQHSRAGNPVCDVCGCESLFDRTSPLPPLGVLTPSREVPTTPNQMSGNTLVMHAFKSDFFCRGVYPNADAQ